MTSAEFEGKRREGRLAEFSALRNEIIYNHGGRLAVLSLCIVVTTSLLAFGFENENEYVFLVAMVIIPSLMSFLETLHISTYRIGGYIQARVEKEFAGIEWQTELERWYMAHRRARGWTVRYFVPLVMPYDALAALCVLGVFRYISSGATAVVTVFLIAVLIYQNWRLFTCGLPSTRAKYRDFFEEGSSGRRTETGVARATCRDEGPEGKS